MRQDATKRSDDIDHQVNPDQVIEPENPCFWDAHGPSHQRVRLFNAKAASHGFVDPDLKRENADPVAEEPRCVRTANDTLTENAVIEIGEPVDHVVARIGAANKLQKAHVAHRIEIVGNRKALAKCAWHVLDQKVDWDRRGV